MYIKPKKFYGALLPLLNKKTPMKENCGDLCGARCCKDSEEGEGMYLYPHEREYLGDMSDFAKIFLSDFQVCGKRTEILMCGGKGSAKINLLRNYALRITNYEFI